MKKKFLISIVVIIVLIAFASAGWYTVFVFKPKSKVIEITAKFEIAARSNDRKAILETVSKDSLLRNLKKEVYDEYFGKFYKGIEITWCIRRAEKILPSNKDRIWAEGRMKAKIDGRYREHFEFLLVNEEGKWKLSQFSFPDFVDY